MTLRWLSRLLNPIQPTARSRALTRRSRPGVERLEDRLTPVSSVTDLTGGVTATQLVQSLVGAGVQISNVKYTGATVAAGKFSGGQTSIGFDQGIILSSGQAKDVIGAGSNFISTTNNTAADGSLGAIVAPDLTYDASVLEFDFVPAGAVLNFQYVFGSEEYPEYVNASFNDVFGFFLNGKNVALIPNTSTPVSIDNVNAGANATYFVDNYTTAARATSLDGLTTVLNVSVNVNPGQSNHIKLAIADAGDSILDSDVFIQAGSFAAPSAPTIKTFNPVRFNYHKATKTYDGLFTLQNIGSGPQAGPMYVLFNKLPQGAWIKNATGVTKSGVPFIKITSTIAAGSTYKLPVKVSNPLFKPLNSFYFAKNLKFAATDPSGS